LIASLPQILERSSTDTVHTISRADLPDCVTAVGRQYEQKARLWTVSSYLFTPLNTWIDHANFKNHCKDGMVCLFDPRSHISQRGLRYIIWTNGASRSRNDLAEHPTPSKSTALLYYAALRDFSGLAKRFYHYICKRY
jgi:hypothetical protein